MIESLFTGLLTGGIYARVAVAYSIIYTTTRVVNFALGEIVMIAAMVTYTCFSIWAIPFLPALIIGCAAAVLVNLIIRT
ncbi:MAG: branched-chain amino acid ABC transporter permease, partial [Deltaproteobacteria bacterium]